MAANLATKKKTICITGKNMIDGMGDVAHIFNVGSSVEKTLTDLEVVYHIEWCFDKKIDNISRLNQLVSLLKKYNIIQKNISIKADTYEDYLEAINKIDRNKFSIFTSCDWEDYLKNLAEKYKAKISNIDYFITVSAPVSFRSHEHARAVFFNNKRVLYIMEHGKPHLHTDYDELGEPLDLMFSMGFATTHLGGENRDVGILLKNNTQISEKEQTEALMQIQNQKFKTLVFGDSVPKLNDAAAFLKTLKKTMFIPTYFIHDEPQQHIEKILAAIKGCLPNDERDILLQGHSFSQPLFFSEAIKSQLQVLGFTKIEYMDNTTDKVNTIELGNGKEGKDRILKVLNKVYLDDDDYDLLNKKLSTTLIGCSGDNSFQDAVSRGAIPIFFPHNELKVNMLMSLYEVLRDATQENRKNWNACLEFLISFRPGLYKTSVFTPELVTQWKEVCVYLIQEHNTHDKLKTVMRDYMNMPPLPVSQAPAELPPQVVPILCQAPQFVSNKTFNLYSTMLRNAIIDNNWEEVKELYKSCKLQYGPMSNDLAVFLLYEAIISGSLEMVQWAVDEEHFGLESDDEKELIEIAQRYPNKEILACLENKRKPKMGC